MNSFYFDKMLMLYNQNKSYVKSCKNAFKKPIVFQKNLLFSNMCTFLSHCYETKNYHWANVMDSSPTVNHDNL